MSNTEAFDQLKWHKFPVLDQGFVCLVDVMGDDAAICRAARTSYQKGTKRVSSDRDLIRYLMRHRHTSPFEFGELVFEIKVPMDCWRQFVRHRTASINEYSTRYSEAMEDCQMTAPDEWRKQSETNKQGSDGLLDRETGRFLTHKLESQSVAAARTAYRDMLEQGVAREQARKILPLSTYTQAYWKIDLHNLLHFLALRMDTHAQHEIRQYAIIIGEQIVKPLFPLVWEAFLDYRVNAMSLTAIDIRVIQNLKGFKPTESEFLERHGIEEWQGKDRCRERDECCDKLKRLGLVM